MIVELRDRLEESVSEKERLAQDYEGERVVLIRELSNLYYELKISNEQHLAADGNADGFINHHQNEVVTWDAAGGSGASLHEIISECSKLLKSTINERQQSEEKMRELHSVLYSKDQEIEILNAKVADLTESSNSAKSDAESKHDNLSQLYEVQLETNRHIEETADRILASLAMVHHQDELLDISLVEKISSIEKSVIFVVDMYKILVSGCDHLKGCLAEVGLDFDKIDEIGTFALAHDKIVELRRKEEDMYQRISSLEDENRNLVEQLEKQKSALENVNAEIGRLSAEVEHEKNRYANTKEKLSMAVTKGKALVLQRDSVLSSYRYKGYFLICLFMAYSLSFSSEIMVKGYLIKHAVREMKRMLVPTLERLQKHSETLTSISKVNKKLLRNMMGPQWSRLQMLKMDVP